MRLKRMLLSAGLIALLMTGGLYAQTSEDIYNGFQLNLFNPGARQAAMGGAATAVSGDISSAYYNPAGLVNMRNGYFSLEFAYNNIKTMRYLSSSVFADGITEVSGDDFIMPSHVGIAIPIGNLVLSAYGNSIVNYSEKYTTEARQIPGVNTILNPVAGQLNLTGYQGGAAIGMKIAEYFALGISIGIHYLDITNETTELELTLNDLSDKTGDPVRQLRTEGNDTSIFFRAGFLFQPIEILTIGGTYAYNPPAEVPQALFLAGDSESGLYYDAILAKFDVPDRFSFGFSLTPSAKFTIAADATWVRYSDMSDIIIASYDNIADNVERGDKWDAFGVEESPEFHVGMEWNIGSIERPFFLRAGFFTNPYHAFTYDGDDIVEDYKWNFASYFPEAGDDDIGFSAGLGFMISNKMRCDAAFVTSEQYDYGMLNLRLFL